MLIPGVISLGTLCLVAGGHWQVNCFSSLLGQRSHYKVKLAVCNLFSKIMQKLMHCCESCVL